MRRKVIKGGHAYIDNVKLALSLRILKWWWHTLTNSPGDPHFSPVKNWQTKVRSGFFIKQYLYQWMKFCDLHLLLSLDCMSWYSSVWIAPLGHHNFKEQESSLKYWQVAQGSSGGWGFRWTVCGSSVWTVFDEIFIQHLIYLPYSSDVILGCSTLV